MRHSLGLSGSVWLVGWQGMLAMSILLGANQAHAGAPTTIRICDDDNFAPFVSTENGQPHGATVELIKMIFHKLALPGPHPLDIAGISSTPMSWMAKDSLYFMLSRNSPNTDWLLPKMNQQIEALKNAGMLQKLMDQALPSQ